MHKRDRRQSSTRHLDISDSRPHNGAVSCIRVRPLHHREAIGLENHMHIVLLASQINCTTKSHRLCHFWGWNTRQGFWSSGNTLARMVLNHHANSWGAPVQRNRCVWRHQQRTMRWRRPMRARSRDLMSSSRMSFEKMLQDHINISTRHRSRMLRERSNRFITSRIPSLPNVPKSS